MHAVIEQVVVMQIVMRQAVVLLVVMLHAVVKRVVIIQIVVRQAVMRQAPIPRHKGPELVSVLSSYRYEGPKLVSLPYIRTDIKAFDIALATNVQLSGNN